MVRVRAQKTVSTGVSPFAFGICIGTPRVRVRFRFKVRVRVRVKVRVRVRVRG